MDISIRKFCMGPRSSYVAAIEFCNTLKKEESSSYKYFKGETNRCL